MESEFRRWLRSIGLEAHGDVFEAEDIDLQTVHHLTDADLHRLGLSLGKRRRLLAAIASLDRSMTISRHAAASAGLTAERRLITVLSVDIVESTRLVQATDPEDLRDLLQRFQTAVTAAVVRYDGYVAKFVGDGVMAYFGWPRAHEDEAERAVRAARDIFTAVRAIAVEEDVDLRVRAGVASSEVVVGDIVGEMTIDDAAATGTAPNLADRLQGFARPFEVVVGPITRRMLRGAFALEDLGEHPMKGFTEPVGVWRVAGEALAATRFEAASAGAFADFQGRVNEIGMLRERWEQARRGEGQVIAISGEPGIGKSRLLAEFRRVLADEPRFGFRFQCSPHFQNRDLHPVIEQLRRTIGIADEDPHPLRLTKLETHLNATSPDPGGDLPLLASLLRIQLSGGHEMPDLAPQALRQRTIESLIAQVLFVSERQTVLLALEDAHWADPSTLDLVADLMHATEPARVLLIITHRPELTRPWPACSHFTALRLNRVGQEQASAIARSVGGNALLPEALETIVMRADGVPLYVEELTKAVIDGGATVAEQSGGVPTTLYNALVSRIDRVGDARRVAQIGAVLGRDFTYNQLSRMLGEDDGGLDRGLSRLLDAGVFTRRGAGGEASYGFRHALIHDAAYATLLRRRRRELHARALDVLSQTGTAEAGHIDLLGHHAAQAEDWGRAFVLFRQAGYEAVERFALREAVAQYRRALATVDHQRQDPALIAEVLDLKFALRNVLWATGGFAEILTHLEKAERLCRTLGDPVRRGWISVYRSASHWQLGHAIEARAAALEGLETAEAEGTRDLAVAAHFYLGCVNATAGDCAAADRCFAQVVSMLPGEAATEKCGLPFAPAIISHSWLIWTHAEQGNFDASDHHARSAMALAEASGLPFNVAHVLYDIGYAEIVRGDIPAAIAALERGLGLIERWGMTYLAPFTMGFLGHACVLGGQVERGVALLDDATRSYARIGLGLFRSLVEAQHAHALIVAGRRDDGLAALSEAHARAVDRGERGHAAFCDLVRGEAAMAAGDRDAAVTALAGAREAAAALGCVPLADRAAAALRDALGR